MDENYGLNNEPPTPKCCNLFEKRFLIPKIYYLFFFISFGSIIPFFAIYFQYRGLTNQEIGILNAIQPFIFCLSNPLWTIMADKYERHKELLLFTQITGMISICLLLVPISDFFPSSYSNQVTFIYFVCIIIVYAVIQSPGSPLLDGITFMQICPDNRLFGRQRVWGAIGWAIGAIISGIFTSLFSKPNFMYFSFLIGGVVFLIFILFFLDSDSMYIHYKRAKAILDRQSSDTSLNDDSDTPLHSINDRVNDEGELKLTPVVSASSLPFFSKLYLFLSNFSLLSFLLFALIYGILQGMLLYTPLYLEDDFGAKELLIGLCIVMSVSLEIPMFFVSPWILQKFSSRTLISLSILALIIRYFGYSLLPYMPSVWCVLFIEPLHGISFGFYFISAVLYVNNIAPTGLATTGQGLVTMMFQGLGRGSGSIIGGFAYYYLGGQLLFLYSGIAAIFLLIYFLLTHRINPSKKAEVVS